MAIGIVRVLKHRAKKTPTQVCISVGQVGYLTKRSRVKSALHRSNPPLEFSAQEQQISPDKVLLSDIL